MPLIERGDSVLVVVDTQPGFVRHDARNAEERAEAAATLERAVWLAAIASQLDIPAIVVEEEPDENGPTEPQLLGRLPAGTPVFTKATFGLAGCPEALAAIRATDRQTPVLLGFETDVCVSQSAIVLRDLGFRAVVVEDAAYSGREQQHQRGLARMRQLGVELTHCKSLAYEWLHSVDYAASVIEAVGERPGSL
jgi:nicotinamidase-related amidase